MATVDEIAQKDQDVIELSSFVDSFLKGDYYAQDSSLFWKNVLEESSTQQTFLKCLIYKYISFIYRLGHKPLKEAMRMIKNIQSHPNPVSVLGMESNRVKADPMRSSSVDVSPHKRGRVPSTQTRRKSNDAKSNFTISRNSIIPTEIQYGKVKRKSSENMNDETLATANEISSSIEGEAATRMREVLYTIFYLVNVCEISRWDFNGLREVYLIWNKARSWEESSCGFEQAIMKKISRPSDNLPEDEKWEQIVTDILNSFHSEESQSPFLNHQQVGNGIKHVAMRFKLLQDQSSVTCALEAIIAVISKMNTRQEESKIVSLLHLFCETVIMAPHIPLFLLQKAYTTIQNLYLMPIPVSATVKEVLDLIQIEMKSPGYFRRTIYFQEKDWQLSSPSSVPPSTASPTNVFVNKGSSNWNNMESALVELTQRCHFMTSELGEPGHQRLVVEHIFHSVFGESSCDLATLRRALQTASKSRLSYVYAETQSVMEQSVSMEIAEFAQESVRQQLETLSSKLVEDNEKYESTKANEPDDDEESLPVIDESADLHPGPSPLPSNQSMPSLPSMIAPPRNPSYLSRALSSESCTVTSCADDAPDVNEENDEPAATNRMDYAQIVMRAFDKDQLSDAIFELVRATAKEFVAEKRKSSGCYSLAQKRYLDKKRSSQLAAEERDSGLIEERDSGLVDDYTESEPGKDKAGSTTQVDSGFPPQNTLKSAPVQDSSKSAQSGEFLKNFKEKGFEERNSRGDKDLERLANSFRYSDLLPDEQAGDKLDVANKNSNLQTNADKKGVRRSKSSVSEFSKSLSTKPPVENKEEGELGKAAASKSKKAKHRFKTWRKKGVKMMKEIRRTSSIHSELEGLDLNISSHLSDQMELVNDVIESPGTPGSPAIKTGSAGSLPPNSGEYFDMKIEPRWRTTSLPVKNSIREKKKGKGKRAHLKDLFWSTNDVRGDESPQTEKNTIPEPTGSHRRHSASPTKQSPNNPMLRAFSCDALDGEKTEEKPSRPDSAGALQQSPGAKKPLSDFGKLHVFPEEDTRSRMDSGILADRSSDDGSLVSPGHSRSGAWEDTGVAGVKFMRKHVLRRNRKSRSSLTHHSQGKLSKRKVLKLAFIGNDRTVGDVARAYYELRRRQLTRAPLLHQIDLRLYYIPVGENVFADETSGFSGVNAPFDLEIAEMLGEFDPWYRSVVTYSTNNLLRIRPSIRRDEVDKEEAKARSNFDPLPTIDKMLASTILSYFRFAIKTSYVPIYKATLRTSSDDVITEVFCCRAEVGNVAYRQAIAAGRFGKMGKLVDLSDDSGPPPAYTTFNYRKFGINGSFLLSRTIDEAFYYRAAFVPIALSGSTADQARFPGADGLRITLQDNDKRIKHLKRGLKVTSQEMEQTYTRLTASEAKLEVTRPVQGTFTVSLDHTLIHTNIKSFEVSRCIAPEFERHNARKRRLTNPSHVMSLPLKTFWPNTGHA